MYIHHIEPISNKKNSYKKLTQKNYNYNFTPATENDKFSKTALDSTKFVSAKNIIFANSISKQKSDDAAKKYVITTMQNSADKLKFKDEKNVNVVTKNIIDNYSMPNRGYHGIEHIANMLYSFNSFLSDDIQSVNHSNEIKFAIIMHDYINGVKDDVTKSAIAACDLLSDDNQANIVQKLIMATDHDNITEPLPSFEENLVHDLDLTILGSNSNEYNKYAAQIRKQYSSVPYDIYCNARIKILKNILNGRIYFTDYYHEKNEKQARMNIENEIAFLKKSSQN